MTFGVTPEGLVIKRLADLRTEINEEARGVYGVSVDLDVRRPLGQFISIMAEKLAQIWELMEQVYNAGYPRTAEGKNFDEVATYAGLQRRAATYSTVGVTLTGVLGTVVPAGTRASVNGSPDSIFATDTDLTIGAGTDAIQKITFSAVPVDGAFTVVYDGESTASIPYTANAAAVESALEALGGLSSVTVTGNFTSGFTITFTGSDGAKPQPLIQLGANTLSSNGVNVGNITISFQTLTPGVLPNVSGTATALDAGPVPAAAGSLTVLEDSVTGWTGITNALDAEQGQAEESDADFKIRRANQLASSGRCTPNAIRARMLEVPDVESCTVYVNNEATTVNSIPPKSVRIVLVGGEEEAIAEKIFDVVAAGIKTHGGELYSLVDDSGFNQDIRWDVASEVLLYVEVNLWVNDDFPADGEDQITEAILAYGETLGTGDDVIVYPYLMRTISVDGITDCEVFIGPVPNPSTDDNITIAADEIAKLDTVRIDINIM